MATKRIFPKKGEDEPVGQVCNTCGMYFFPLRDFHTHRVKCEKEKKALLREDKDRMKKQKEEAEMKLEAEKKKKNGKADTDMKEEKSKKAAERRAEKNKKKGSRSNKKGRSKIFLQD